MQRTTGIAGRTVLLTMVRLASKSLPGWPSPEGKTPEYAPSRGRPARSVIPGEWIVNWYTPSRSGWLLLMTTTNDWTIPGATGVDRVTPVTTEGRSQHDARLGAGFGLGGAVSRTAATA